MFGHEVVEFVRQLDHLKTWIKAYLAKAQMGWDKGKYRIEDDEEATLMILFSFSHS